MRARVQKWGNSLGIRIPRALAQEVDVAADTEVEIAARNGKILISPLGKKALTLRQLLLRVTNANLHKEVESGSPVGKEGW